MNRINFWGIGAQKSGSTWLYSNLCKIPEFWLPPIKELHYFDRLNVSTRHILNESMARKRLLNYNYSAMAVRDISYATFRLDFSDLSFFKKWYFENYSDQWYSRLFREDKICGEITPAYAILGEQEIERMHKISPDAKIIYLLRNPIDRAWSAYRFNKYNRNSNRKNIKDLQINEYIHLDGVKMRSDYLKTINTYLKYFKNGQLVIVFYDYIKIDPKYLLSELIRAISKDDINIDHLDLNRIIKKSKNEIMSDEIRYMLQDYYYQDILELQRNFGSGFKNWLENMSSFENNTKNYYNKSDAILIC